MEADDLSALVETTKKEIKEFVEFVDSIRLIHPMILSTRIPDPKAEQALADAMSQIKENNVKIRRNFSTIEYFLKNLHYERGLFLDGMHNYQCLLDSYFAVIRSYHEEQEAFKAECKNLLKNHLNDADVTVTEEEIDEMLQAENFSEYMQNYAVVSEEQRHVLELAEIRHKTITSLQKCIDLLSHQMSDHEQVVHSMNELVGKTNRIESVVENSSECIDKATQRIMGKDQNSGHSSPRFIPVL